MAAPTLVDSDTDVQASGGDNDLDFVLAGGTPSNGDFLVAVLCSTTNGRKFSVPSGWTEAYNSFDAAAEHEPIFQLMYKVASSEASGNYAFAFGAYGNACGALMRWSGVDSGDLGTVTTNLNQADDANIVSPAITPANADSIVLRIVLDGSLSSGSDNINGPPASHTRITGTPINNAGGYSLLCVDYRTQGASSSGTATYDASPDYHANFDAYTWCFGPSGGGGGTKAPPIYRRSTRFFKGR